MVKALYECMHAVDEEEERVDTTEDDLSASMGSISIGERADGGGSVVALPSSMVMNIETVPENLDENGSVASLTGSISITTSVNRTDMDTEPVTIEIPVVEVANSEEMEALKWADKQASILKASDSPSDEDEDHRHVVFARRSLSAEFEEDHKHRRLSLLGQLQGAGGGPTLRRTLSNTEQRAEQRRAKEAKEKEARRQRRALRSGTRTIDVDSDCESDEEEEREAMNTELTNLLGSVSRIAIATHVDKGAILGRGRFACVFAGSWRPPQSSQSGEEDVTDVAVKEFMFGTSRKTAPLPVQRVFHREAITLATLAHHPKVMDLVGVVLVPRPMILLELLNVGSLFDGELRTPFVILLFIISNYCVFSHARRRHACQVAVFVGKGEARFVCGYI